MTAEPLYTLSGLGWRPGRHGGTLVGARGLELIPGVSRGVYERSLEPAPRAFSRLVASLEADPYPIGAAVRVSLRADEPGPSRWCSLGIFGSGRSFPQSEACPPEPDQPRVAVDEWLAAQPTRRVSLRLELEAGELGGSPLLRRLTLEAEPEPQPSDDPQRAAWGRTLALPTYSQREAPGELPERGCSPTSLAMVLAFYGHALGPAEVGRRVYDHGAQLYGNWSFNAAAAAELGLEARVRRPGTLRFLEEEILAGRPAIVSQRFGPGELPQSPLPETAGHLLVVVGFDPAGEVIVHDPAADPRAGQEVRRTYPRAAFRRSWLEGSGITYQIGPPQTPA